MATFIHAIGKRPRQIYRVYGTWGERRFPEIRSKSELYRFLASDLGLPATVSRKDVVFSLLEKTWNGTKWVDDFRAKLKSNREAKSLTQAQLAERAALSLEGIRALEQGIRRPSSDTVRRLAVALELKVEDLISVPEIDPSSESHEVLFP